MLRGASPAREREYEDLKEKFEEEGRYPGREEEVAARIVNKQRTDFSETQAARADDLHGESPDEGLPISRYDHLTVDEITHKLDDLSHDEMKEIRAYESKHRDRRTLLEEIERRLNA